MKKNKENVVNDYINMIKESWTWDRLTHRERKNFITTVYNIEKRLKGSYLARFETLNMMYTSFLSALDYKPVGWRVND